MEFGVALVLTLFLIGFIGSFISGMVGIGGSIIKYPMLLYIPPLLGVAAYTAQEVSAISAIQVFFASLAGMIAYRKSGMIHRKLVVMMGIPIVIGSFIGGFGSKYLPDSAINLIFAFMALAAATMMFMPKRGESQANSQNVEFSSSIAGTSAGVVGTLSGIVGAAGAFITIPIMLVILKVPTRVAIASSLAITFLSSIGSAAGKVFGGHMLLMPSIIMVVASLIASPLGAMLGQKVNVKLLQWVLVILITATVVKIWWDIFA
jgi:uncharacterized membrane protein YfcA